MSRQSGRVSELNQSVSLFSIGGVICCGNTVFDIAVWPVENCDWNTTTWVQNISEGIGGNGANTSYALAVLGVPVSLISVVGEDQPGRRLLEILQSVSVRTSRVRQVGDLSTASTVILVHADGDRKFLHRPGASRSMCMADISDLTADKDITHFHFANPFALPLLRENTAEVLRLAKDAGLTTSVDTGWDSRGRWMLDLGPALRYTDLLFVNEAEAFLLGWFRGPRHCNPNHSGKRRSRSCGQDRIAWVLHLFRHERGGDPRIRGEVH